MKRRSIDKGEVKELARGRWLEIHAALAGAVLGEALERRPGTHVRCPFHGGEGDFRFDGPRSRYGSAADNGGAICTCGSWSDGFALLMQANGWSFRRTLVEVARYLGMPVDDLGRIEDTPRERRRLERARARAEQARRRRARRQAQADARAVRTIREVWDAALPVTHPRARPLQRYLGKRGLTALALADCPDVRFHPELPYYHRTGSGVEKLGAYPAMVALVRDCHGEPVTLHRTWLTPKGCKLPIGKAKKLMTYPSGRSLSGGAIRLFESGAVLGVAEGIETALACQYAMGVPVWAAVSASMLEAFVPPPGTKALVIWADKDRSGAGLEAARKLKRRVWQQGIRCRIELPELPIPEGAKGVDWNDVWRQIGRIGFPRWRRRTG